MKTSKSFTNDGISKGNLINLESGRIPPQAIDLEEAVIGAMLIDKKGVDEVIDILTPEVFYKESNKLIFECVLNTLCTVIAIVIIRNKRTKLI